MKHSYGLVKRLTVVVMSVILMVSLMTTFNMGYVYADEAPEVSAESVVLMSGSTGEIIYTKNAERKLPINVTPKIMLAMVVIDKMGNETFEDTVTMTYEASRRGDLFTKNEIISINDLMNAMLLDNSDEAAAMLAIHYCGTVSGGVDQINSKAQQMRLKATNFTNLTGEYDSKQFSTPLEVAQIYNAAQRYDKIAEILQKDSHKLGNTNKHRSREIYNRNPFLPGKPSAFNGMYGGMLGYLSEPTESETFVGSAYRDDMNVIVVVMDEPKGKASADVPALLFYGYRNVTRTVAIKKDAEVGTVKIRCGEKTHLKVYTARTGYVYIPPEGSQELMSTSVDIFSGVTAPVKAGDKVGVLNIYVAGDLKGTVDLIIKEDVDLGWYPSYIYISNTATIMICVVFGIALILLLRAAIVNRRRAKERERRRREKIREEAMRRNAIEDDRANRNWTYGEYRPTVTLQSTQVLESEGYLPEEEPEEEVYDADKEKARRERMKRAEKRKKKAAKKKKRK